MRKLAGTFCWLAVVVFTHHTYSYAQSPPTMCAHCIDVGQGDATLLEFPCGAVLVDAGGQDKASANRLIQYLDKFFQSRPDLTNTLQAIYITHPHKDHTYALKNIVQDFTVKRFIENGQDYGSGISDVRWVRSVAPQRHIILRKISNAEIMAAGNRKGITDDIIDPLKCETCDPKIVILSGRWDENPGWPDTEFDNNNNHSLVIRVDFGASSFMFIGNMEDDAIDSFLTYYNDGEGYDKILHVDVYHVGHHGAENGTTAELVKALAPSLAVISCGRWDYGQDSNSKFTTWAYGHPRKATVDLLNKAISSRRPEAVHFYVATKSKTFYPVYVRKNIYATPWDGNIKVSATLNEQYTVTRNN